MFESLELTEENFGNEGIHHNTETKVPSQEALLRRFDLCFNEDEKSEIISLLTS